MIAQPGHHHEDAPQTEDDAGHRRQQFDENNQRLPYPARGKFGQVNRRGDAQGDRDNQRDSRGDQRSENKRQCPELLTHGVPERTGQKSPSEFLLRQLGTVKKLVPGEDDQNQDRQRHEERQPLEGAVAERAFGQAFSGQRARFSERRSKIRAGERGGERGGPRALRPFSPAPYLYAASGKCQ